MTATFGTLQGATLELEDGLNLIYAPNEGGKSTWCVFLRTMLYGFPQRERDKKGVPADKNRYRPWNGGAMEGLLDCTYQGARILLRRFDDQGIPMGGFSAVYADTGDPVAGLTGENVGETLTGVGREVFERTVFLRQTHLSVDPSTELEQRIAALLSSGDEQVSWSQAESRLRQWQRDRRYHKSGQLIALEEEAAVLGRQLSQVKELHRDYLEQEETVAGLEAALLALEPSPGELSPGEAEAAELSFAEAAAELDAATLQLENLEAEEAELEGDALEALEEEGALRERGIRRRGRAMTGVTIFGIGLALFLVAMTFLPLLIPDIPLPTLRLPSLTAALALLGIILLLGTLIRLRLDRWDQEEIDRLGEELLLRRSTLQRRDMEWETAIAREKSARALLELLSRNREAIPYRSPEAVEAEQTLQESRRRLALLTGKLQAVGDPAALEARLEENRRRQRRLQEEYDAITIALDLLGEAERALRARFSPTLNQRTAAYFNTLTGGAYETVTLDRAFSAQTEARGSHLPRSAAQLSRGAADQLYMALRLALCDLVLPAEAHCPIVLDDALINFDDTRLAYALELLTQVAEKRQVLLFTCHRREQAYFEDGTGQLRQTMVKKSSP
jgi:hypothetical protein